MLVNMLPLPRPHQRFASTAVLNLALQMTLSGSSALDNAPPLAKYIESFKRHTPGWADLGIFGRHFVATEDYFGRSNVGFKVNALTINVRLHHYFAFVSTIRSVR
jgi:hypothetical protein